HPIGTPQIGVGRDKGRSAPMQIFEYPGLRSQALQDVVYTRSLDARQLAPYCIEACQCAASGIPSMALATDRSLHRTISGTGEGAMAYNNWGQVLRELLERYNKKQSHVARAARIDPGQLHRWM